jgi:hypothetical protein
MTNFIKNYIGKGKQVEEMDIVKIFIPVDKLEACTFEKDGTRFVGFEVAKMLNPDKFGRTHTVYFTEKATPAPPKEPAKRARKRKEVPATNDLPF